MKRQAFNPFLPLDTYIPDGEPHVFGDRVYLYGSHDAEGGMRFCPLDYECWSAPADDLTDWRREGTIYRAQQCPHYTAERHDIYAPDAVQGNDGKYYLYYCLGGFEGPISVAVCDTPAGKYEHYGDVQYPDGRPLLRFIPFDPAVLNDDGRILLTYGWGFGFDLKILPEERSLSLYKQIVNKEADEIRSEEPHTVLGANIAELENDMLTVKSEPARILDAAVTAPEGSELRKHSFFEASSLRKFNGLYYFIYSSHEGHELCYATSPFFDRGYTYRGVIISNGDIGLQGRKPEDRLAFTGTNHGSLECIHGEYYIFYHRNTHLTQFSRQACAEKVTLLPDGTIEQVEMTSCGLNGGPLKAKGRYPAPYCCNLTNGYMEHASGIAAQKPPKPAPHINHAFDDRYIKDIENGTLIGYKYFTFCGEAAIAVETRGNGRGKLQIMTTPDSPLAEIEILPRKNWTYSPFVSIKAFGTLPLYFYYRGDGKLDCRFFEIR